MLLQTALLVVACAAAVFAGAMPAAAVDRPIGADRLLLRDVTHPKGARVRFSVEGEPALATGSVGDPRVTGATLEIVGDAAGDGGSGVIPLRPAGWQALGTPSAGYAYLDDPKPDGLRRVELRTTPSGGSLLIVGGSAAWPYRVTKPQGTIDVRLTIGDVVVCARLTGYAHNGAGRVVAVDAAAPAQCAPRTVRCGNRVVDGDDDCDDGNPNPGDGCTPQCGLVHPGAACAGVPSAFGDAVAAELVTDGLVSPVHLAAPPLDPHRLFVVEQEGRVRIVEDGVLLPTPFLAIENAVLCCGERGLLSIAFHPGYATNRRFFVYYTDNDGRLVLARYEASALDPDLADPATRRIVLRIAHPGHANHNGGQLAFGPDGYLYMGPGDGGGGGDPGENAQDPTSLLGKLLRIDVDVEDEPYRAVPPSNPAPGAGPKLGLIWALGLRNPWRFSFDRLTGDLYVGDVGQGQREEINFRPASSAGGENYGWDVFEGSSCFEPPGGGSCPSPAPFVFPVLEYTHAAGCSVTGGFVYRGCALPELRGTYFYSDFCSAFVRTFRGVANGVAQSHEDRTAELAPGGGRTLDNVTSFGEDARGELYVLDRDGEVYRIVPAS
ncbi:MAG: PQQ-dependent sugar dehydrogenase [Thermodesulfobacteriota bacterium]